MLRKASHGRLGCHPLRKLWCGVTHFTWGLSALGTRFQSASQRIPAGPGAAEASASRKPSRDPAPERPSSAGSWASRALLPPHVGITGLRGAREARPPAPRVPARSRTGGAAAARRLGPPGGRESRASDSGSPGLGPHPRTGPEAGPRPGRLLFHVVPQRLAQVLLGRLQLAHKGRHCSARLSPTLGRAAHGDQQPKDQLGGRPGARDSEDSAPLVGPAPGRSGDLAFVWFSAPPVSPSG